MKRQIEIVVFAALAVAASCWIAWSVYRSHTIEGFRRELVAKGFPEGYARPLSKLQFEHREWVFEPVGVADLTWDRIVEKELTPSWNLVVYADWAPNEWKALKEKNYTPYYAKDAKAYDSGAWYQASRETIEYFMDPRNWLNEREIFMFETLQFDARSQTPEAVERTLSKTFMAKAKCGGAKGTFAELLMDVGRKLGVSPVFLAGRLASEQGFGSPQSFGTLGDCLVGLSTNRLGKVGDADVWGKRFTRDGEATKKVLAKGAAAYNGYYNFFNFRAYGLGLFEIKYNAWVEATADETRARYLGPWDSQARAIEGGAMKIKERYIDTYRHTRYFQKFSVLPAAKDFRWKQYMQNIAAPLVEARNTSKAYAAADTLDAPYRFLIPVYIAMPKRACPDPAGGKSIYSSFD
ncbi:MAG: hypothetical protein IKB76_02535 [Kiritimatiellae bacterium]|nr:hypothetical protein [Kiritimatiellia bacterium]